MALDLARRHAAGVHRQYLVVEAVPARLPLGSICGSKLDIAVARNLDLERAEVALQTLPARPVTAVATAMADSFMLLVPQVRGQLSRHRTLQNRLGQLLQKTMLAGHQPPHCDRPSITHRST